MLKVPQQQYIRYLREVENCNIREIADRMGISWRTARKYADRDDWNQPIERRKGHFPVLGPFIEIIDTWLVEDESLPRKQHHTARKIFHRLQNEYGFPGGERTVSEYVAKRKRAMKLERSESYQRLTHPGGEAQADFGTVYIVKAGELVQRKVLTLSFPYSNAAVVFPVPAENTECFIEALKRLFEQIGGVPRKIWFDNLSAAVVSIQAHGERVLTDAFTRLCAHYRFEPLFCNPASGNEKGNVENKVGYGRRNWCVPPPVVDSPEQFEQYLKEAALADMQRAHYAKGERIAVLWEQERSKLLQLPIVPLEVYRLETTRLSKYAELVFDDAKLPLPQCKALEPVMLKVKWDVVEVLSADGQYQLIATLPRPYTEKPIPIDWRSVFDSYCKKPRSVMYSSFANMMPESLRNFVRVDDVHARKSRVSLIHRLLATYSLEEITSTVSDFATMEDEQQLGSALEHALYAARHPEFRPEPFLESHTPPAIQGQAPTLQAYDQRLGVRMG